MLRISPHFFNQEEFWMNYTPSILNNELSNTAYIDINRRLGENLRLQDFQFDIKKMDLSNCSYKDVEVKLDMSSERVLNVEVQYSNVGVQVGVQKEGFSVVGGRERILRCGGSRVGCLDVFGGSYLTGHADGGLYIWDVEETGDAVKKLEGHVGDVNCAKFFPSGLVIISAGLIPMINIYGLERDGACVAKLLGHEKSVNDVGFIGVGRETVTCSADGSTVVWDVSTQAKTMVFNSTGEFTCLAIHENNLIFSCTNEGLIYRNDKRMVEPNISYNHGHYINKVVVNDNHCIVGDDRGVVSFYDVRMIEKGSVYNHRWGIHPISSMSQNNGKIVVGTGEGIVYEVPEEGNNLVRQYVGGEDVIYGLGHINDSILSVSKDCKARLFTV